MLKTSESSACSTCLGFPGFVKATSSSITNDSLRMTHQSWISGGLKPRHIAFVAHASHVITCLQFDDDKIITGSDDMLIHIHDVKTGELRKTLQGHEGGIWALQYEGNTLVSGATDMSARVWDIDRGLCRHVFRGHTSTVRCLQIVMPAETGRDSNGRAIMEPAEPLIITGSRDSQLRIWRLPESSGDVQTLQTHLSTQESGSDSLFSLRTLSGHSQTIRSISAHGDTLVSGSFDCTVGVWRISTGELRYRLTGHSASVYSVVLDHQRNRAVSGSLDTLVKIWDLTDGSCLFTLDGDNQSITRVDLRNGLLVSAGPASTLRVWDPETGTRRNTLKTSTGQITCFQHDGSKIICGGEKAVTMWDAQTGEWVQDLLTDLSGVWQVKFDERRCVAAVQRGELTYIEVFDFGAAQDGFAAEELGKRILIE